MYRTNLLILTIILLATIGYFALKPKAENTVINANLPWQISVHENGTSSIFGIQLETNTVAETIQRLGEDHDLAIISDHNNHSGLEIYYSHFAAGPIKGKLIIAVDALQNELQLMQAQASSSSYTPTGSRKFLINSDDLKIIQSWPVTGMSFVPSASLDEEIIEARFGKPSDKLSTGKGETHFLYPLRGLDITLNEEAKEVLQYVAPRSFSRLLEPLKSYPVEPSPTR